MYVTFDPSELEERHLIVLGSNFSRRQSHYTALVTVLQSRYVTANDMFYQASQSMANDEANITSSY